MGARTTSGSLLSEATVASFERDGFVVVPGLLTDEELDRYGRLVTDAVADRTALDDTPLEQKSRYQQSFVQCMNLWEDHPGVAPLTFHPRLGQAAAELLRVPAIRLWHDQALYKQPGGRRDGRPPGPPLLAHRRDRVGDRVGPLRGVDAGLRGDGLPPGEPCDRPAQVRQHLLRRARGHPGRPRGGRHRAACSWRCPRGAWRSTTASRCTWPTPTRPTARGPCTR